MSCNSFVDVYLSDVVRVTVSLMHVLPAPVGVVFGASYSSSDGLLRVDSQLSGSLHAYTKLVPGMVYFGNTFGEVFNGQIYYGQDEAASYAEDKASNTLMTGKIGVAVSDSTLLLKV